MLIRLERKWDALNDKLITRIGAVCECGQIIPYFVQIQPMEREDKYCECCGQEL